MLLRYYLIGGNILLAGSLFAQSNTVTAGANASGSGGSVSYTIGQIDYISASGSNGSLNQGVQQPYEFFSTSGLEEYSEVINLSMGPNPTSDVLYITLQDDLIKDLNFQLYDDQGKIVFAQAKLEKQNELSMKELPSAMYQLVVKSGSKELKTYKIIKH